MTVRAETLAEGVTLYPGDCLDVLAAMQPNSLDSCVTDPPYLLTSIVSRFGGENAAPAQFGTDGRFARMSGGFMNKKWDAPESAIGVSMFEAWLAGFIAGEGCFRIQAHKERKYYTCSFSVHLRADDAPILVACQKRIGGRIVFGDERTNKQGIVSAPDVRWIVESRSDCFVLAGILDRVPLFAKKAADYALWRRGLELWETTPKANRWHGPRDVSEMAALHDKLKAVKRWDGSEIDLNFDPFMPPAQAFHYKWARQVFRVLKPGGHLLAFGGTRTYHRLASAIEDAGFEVRDAIMWHYGSGFPKSHDVSKGIDRAAGAEREIIGRRHDADKRQFGGKHPGWDRPWMHDEAACERHVSITAPATAAARQWDGWGTALKPATEIICLARKPLSEGTVASNVLKWGTGALNIDGCRVATDWANDPTRRGWQGSAVSEGHTVYQDGLSGIKNQNELGRWPANVITDGSEEVVAAFPYSVSNDPGTTHVTADGWRHKAERRNTGYAGDAGSAARFFYTAKADSDDRLGSKHPTVKPVDLIQYLVRLVTPKGGLCLDPFAGTGTLGEACIREGMRAVLIEREAEYQEDIRRRMKLAMAGPDERARETAKARNPNPDLGPLFADYAPRDDFNKSVDECYRAVKQRVAQGGPNWKPPT